MSKVDESTEVVSNDHAPGQVNGVTKKTRVRGITKKYTEQEVLRILKYLRSTIINGHEIEKPNAREYYKHMIAKLNLKGCTNTAIISKIAALKKKYDGAIKWRNETGQSCDEGTVDDKVNEMCPHFDIMDEIYGHQITFHPLDHCDTGMEDASLDTLENVDDVDIEDVVNGDESVEHVEEITENERSTLTRHDENRATCGGVGNVSKKRALGKTSDFVAVSNTHKVIKLAEYAVEEKRLEYNTKKLEIEKTMDIRKLELEEKQMMIEESKLELEYKLAESHIRKIEDDMLFRREELRMRMELKLKKMEYKQQLELAKIGN